MSHPADMNVIPGRPNTDTHDRVGSTWVPKEERALPSSTEMAAKGQLGPPLIDANELLGHLDADSKTALTKIADPNCTDRNFWAGVLWMSGRVQHRLIFKVEPPDEGKGAVNEA